MSVSVSVSAHAPMTAEQTSPSELIFSTQSSFGVSCRRCVCFNQNEDITGE